MIFEGKNL